MLRVTFVMEQHVGHRTFYENLRRFIDPRPDIAASWTHLTYVDPDSLWHKIPLIPAGKVGPLIGREQVVRGLKKQPYDIAFFSTQVGAALAPRLARQRPYVLCTDISPIQYDRMAVHYGHEPDGDSWLSRWKERLNISLFQGARGVICWSQWAAGSIAADYGVDPDRIAVIPVGVDLDFWRPDGDKPTASHDGPVKILFVGGDWQRKGGDLLLDAYRRLPAGTAELHLVTRSPVEPEPGVVVYRDLSPNTPELVRLFQTSDLFVLPTRAEAFGIVAVEASAAGLPCIVTRVGGLPEIVVDGETGFHVEPEDCEELLERLTQLVADPALRRRMGAAAAVRGRAAYNAGRNAERIVRFLHEAHNLP